MAAMSLPEAYTLTRDNIPNLTEAEEEAFLTYMNHFRYENLNKTISSILDDVYDHINRTWNSHVPDNSLRLSIVNQVGTNQDLRNMETLREVLFSHRPWWPQEQDHEFGPRTRHRSPTDPFFLRLQVFRSPQAVMASWRRADVTHVVGWKKVTTVLASAYRGLNPLVTHFSNLSMYFSPYLLRRILSMIYPQTRSYCPSCPRPLMMSSPLQSTGMALMHLHDRLEPLCFEASSS